jgi:hypothetical protein
MYPARAASQIPLMGARAVTVSVGGLLVRAPAELLPVMSYERAKHLDAHVGHPACRTLAGVVNEGRQYLHSE